MPNNQQLKRHPACPFQERCNANNAAVVTLFQAAAKAAQKNLRDFAFEMLACDPYVCASKQVNSITLTAYAQAERAHAAPRRDSLGKAHVVIDCSKIDCPSRTKLDFFLGKCDYMPIKEMPEGIMKAAKKELKK